jgi:hypothetical protein
MLTVSGTNWKPFPPPTMTSKVVPVGDGTPFTAGLPFRSRMRMGGAPFAFAVFARFWPDSARTRHPTAKMAASQKINRGAFDIFILLVLFYASVRWILFRIAGEALRLSDRHIAQAPAKKTSRIFKRQRQNASIVGIKR